MARREEREGKEGICEEFSNKRNGDGEKKEFAFLLLEKIGMLALSTPI